jgi:hypothetical protein
MSDMGLPPRPVGGIERLPDGDAGETPFVIARLIRVSTNFLIALNLCICIHMAELRKTTSFNFRRG